MWAWVISTDEKALVSRPSSAALRVSEVSSDIYSTSFPVHGEGGPLAQERVVEGARLGSELAAGPLHHRLSGRWSPLPLRGRRKVVMETAMAIVDLTDLPDQIGAYAPVVGLDLGEK